jgi:membrane protein YqaA with SNARE-associated domain
MEIGPYLLACAVVFAINLLPAFGPPTWSVLVVLTVNSDLSPPALVVGGALAAASGRFVLATVTRRFRSRLNPQRRRSLTAASDFITADSRRAIAGLSLFALSPVPSAQLFVAAGLLDVKLLPLTAAFFAGRLVSYSLYVGLAAATADSLGTVISDSLTSPLGIALQLVMLAGLVALVRVDWVGLLARRADRAAPTHAPRPRSAAGS